MNQGMKDFFIFFGCFFLVFAGISADRYEKLHRRLNVAERELYYANKREDALKKFYQIEYNDSMFRAETRVSTPAFNWIVEE